MSLPIQRSFGVLFLDAMFGATDRGTGKLGSRQINGELNDNTFSIRDQDSGLNMDLTTYSIYTLVRKDSEALLYYMTPDQPRESYTSTFDLSPICLILVAGSDNILKLAQQKGVMLKKDSNIERCWDSGKDGVEIQGIEVVGGKMLWNGSTPRNSKMRFEAVAETHVCVSVVESNDLSISAGMQLRCLGGKRCT
jgi:hypothetical protein